MGLNIIGQVFGMLIKKSRVMSCSGLSDFAQRSMGRAKWMGEEKYVDFCNLVLTEIRKPIRENELVWNYKMRYELIRISEFITVDAFAKLMPWQKRIEAQIFARMFLKGRRI